MPVTFVKASAEDPILRAAARMEPRIRAAFLRAVALLRQQLTVDELAKAIAAGDVNQALAMLAVDARFVKALQGVGLEANIQSVRDALQATFAAGASVASTALPNSIGVKLSFDLFNPETVKFLEGYTFPLIRQISGNTADAIREVLTDAFREGGHPREQARRIRSFIGLTPHQARAVRNFRSALSSPDTMARALDRKLRDGRYDGTVERAMRNGARLNRAQVDAMVDRYNERFLAHRARTIARTESIRASNMGQRALWKQAVAQDLMDDNVKRIWIASRDSDTCEECLELDGEVAGLDDAFSSGVCDPPDPHPTCRCTTALVFPKAA